jgi:hypothetical protein
MYKGVLVMVKAQKLQTKEECKNERTIGVKELLREIKPMLQEYYIARTTLLDDGVLLRFLNGQVFKIGVQEMPSMPRDR